MFYLWFYEFGFNMVVIREICDFDWFFRLNLKSFLEWKISVKVGYMYLDIYMGLWVCLLLYGVKVNNFKKKNVFNCMIVL